MNKYGIIVVAGMSGAGKDTLVDMFIKEFGDQVNLVISHATRPMRYYEKDGVEHWFHSKEEFHELIDNKKLGEMIAYVHMTKDGVSGNEYCTFESDYSKDKINIYILDPNGMKDLLSRSGDKVLVKNVYIHTSTHERIQRIYQNRGMDEVTKWMERNADEKDQFDEFRINRRFDEIHINEDCTIEQSYEGFRKIMLKFYKEIILEDARQSGDPASATLLDHFKHVLEYDYIDKREDVK